MFIITKILLTQTDRNIYFKCIALNILLFFLYYARKLMFLSVVKRVFITVILMTNHKEMIIKVVKVDIYCPDDSLNAQYSVLFEP